MPGEVVFRVPSLAIPDPSGRRAARELLELRGRAAVRRAGRRGRARASRSTTTNARRGRPHLPPPRRPAARARARRRPRSTRSAPARSPSGSTTGSGSCAPGSRTAPTRQQTLEAALDWSHDLLEPRRARPAAPPGGLLRRLRARGGRGGVRRRRARAGAGGRRARAARREVARHRPRSAGRPALPAARDDPRVRRARLAEAGRARGALPAPGRVARRLVERDDSQLSGLDPERGNLRAALETLLAGDPPAALRLCARVWPFWLRRIELAEARRWLGEALERAPEPRRAGARRCSGTPRSSTAPAGTSGWASAKRTRPRARARARRARAGVARDPLPRRHRDRARRRPRGRGPLRGGARGRARARLAAPEAVSVYSLGVAAWVAGDLAAAEERFAESRAVRRPRRTGRDRPGAHQRRPDRRPGSGRARPAARLRGHAAAVRRGLLRRAPPATSCSTGRTSPRGRGDPARARTLLAEALERFERAGDERGRADVGAAREPRPRRGRRRGGGGAVRASADAARAAAATGAARRSRSSGSARRPPRGDYDEPSAAPGGRRHLPPCRRPLGARVDALAHGGARAGARPARRAEASCSSRRSPWSRRPRTAGGRR